MCTRHRLLRLNATSFAPTRAELDLYEDAGIDVLLAEEPGGVTDERGSVALCTVSAKVGRGLIDQLPGLRVISRFGSGTDNVDVAYASQRGVAVTNVPGFCVSEVAEHTMALLLA